MDLTIQDKKSIKKIDDEIIRLTKLIEDFPVTTKMIIGIMLKNLALVIILNLAFYTYNNYYDFSIWLLIILVLTLIYPIYRIIRGVYTYKVAIEFIKDTKNNIKEYKVMKEIIIIENKDDNNII